ncbi:hypothetical protein CEXT_653551 [Caerostris extrusa]|uniref:Uncharacterized protein n=1 Tax=Caerostris extrusa TaxID=172846 RepID=A0AAV4NAW0_CAEEX|nr:hypothetical protein CEXT_653551 [Caerostris extrusa]
MIVPLWSSEGDKGVQQSNRELRRRCQHRGRRSGFHLWGRIPRTLGERTRDARPPSSIMRAISATYLLHVIPLSSGYLLAALLKHSY